jgi:hypothetical protein
MILVALLALLLAAVALSRLGPAPAAAVLRINANPPVHQTAPESLGQAPGAVISIADDGVETDGATVNAGALPGGVTRAGGLAGGVDGRD